LKPERWGSSLAQEKCREEKACDKRHPYNNNNNNNNNNSGGTRPDVTNKILCNENIQHRDR